jgi:hypothetical protein
MAYIRYVVKQYLRIVADPVATGHTEGHDLPPAAEHAVDAVAKHGWAHLKSAPLPRQALPLC